MRRLVRHCFKRSILAGALFALLLAPGRIMATVLNPGGSVTNPASSAAPSGLILATTGPVNVESPGFFSGTVTSSVLADASNPFGSNDLTFTYEFDYTGWDHNFVNTDVISRITVSPYAPPENPVTYSTDARWSTVSGGVSLAVINRPGTGDAVGFSWALSPLGHGKIGLGGNSNLLVVYTNATQYMTGNVSIIGTGTLETPSFAPAPEPSTFVMLGLGIVSLFGYCLRKRFG